MIALDTNVLVRLLLRDDETQAARARDLFEANADNAGSLFISDVVLAELAWVLRSRYALPSGAITRAMRALLDDTTLAWQSRAAAQQALALYAAAGGDFADCLVVALAQAHGCEGTATFDVGMRALPGVRLMERG